MISQGVVLGFHIDELARDVSGEREIVGSPRAVEFTVGGRSSFRAEKCLEGIFGIPIDVQEERH